MRKLLILLLLLAACDSDPAPEIEPVPDGALSAAAGAPSTASPAEQAAQNQQRASQALAVILADPESARYSDVRAGAAGSVCGLVDAKQAGGKYAGPRPFVVTPEGVAVISTTPQVMFDDPEDLFPDFYIRWCASPEELRGIGPRIASGPIPDMNLADDLTSIVDGAVPPPPPSAEPQPVEAAKATPPPAQPPGEEDSFSRAVLRNRSDGAPR
jgi:hypothetical protein